MSPSGNAAVDAAAIFTAVAGCRSCQEGCKKQTPDLTCLLFHWVVAFSVSDACLPLVSLQLRYGTDFAERSSMNRAVASPNAWIMFGGCVLVVAVLHWAQALFVPICLAILL